MKFNALLILTGILIASVTGCKKYEDGPGISFRTRKERLVNDWKVNVAYAYGLDVTEDYQTFSIDIKGDGTFLAKTIDEMDSVHLQEGLWDFVEKDEQVRLLYTEPLITPDRSYWTILRLKETELRVLTDIDSVEHEFRFIPN